MISALIVDDEPLARDGLRALLAEDAQVSTVLEAKNGREAVAAILERRPDLVFLDVQMPEMDVVLRNDVRLRSSRSYHERVKGLASNPF